MDDMNMSLSHSHGSMGGMSMGDGPDLFYLQKVYWAVVGAVIAAAAVTNVLHRMLFWQRMNSLSSHSPARPKSCVSVTLATMTAITRESSNVIISIGIPRDWQSSSLTVGKLFLILADLILVLVLCFYKLDTTDQWQFEDIGYRTGFIAAAQLPLVILLAGKRNIIGYLAGTSYERLNWLHRWVSRILFLTVTIHMGLWFRSWARYDYISTKVKTDAIVRRGLAAWCILLWILVGSFAPVRKYNYQFFVVQHVITFIGFLVAVFLHLPAEVKVYIWLPIALYIFDRALRTLLILVNNLSLFHRNSNHKGILACEGKLEPLVDGASRIIIEDPPFKWMPGQHVFLSCHGIAPLRSHPFTIASIPEERRLEFIIKSRAGATKRYFTRAGMYESLPTSNADVYSQPTFPMIVDGPYGHIRPLRQFDSVFLIAGSNGGSFTIPLLKDIVSAWNHVSTPRSSRSSAFDGAGTRYVRFVWIIKSVKQYSWLGKGLGQAIDDVQRLRAEGHHVALDVSVYITCDTSLDPENPACQKPQVVLAEHGRPKTSREFNQGLASQEKLVLDHTSVRSSSSKSAVEEAPINKACRPDGTCCCATTIEDEEEMQSASGSKSTCHCNENLPRYGSEEGSVENEKVAAPGLPRGEDGSGDMEQQSTTPIHPGTSVFTGRPQAKTLIRKMLEQARGESAVVVCGPRGLNDDVRTSVVGLSDERAIHKGTGAQGVYFWEEGFQY